MEEFVVSVRVSRVLGPVVGVVGPVVDVVFLQR